MVQCHSVVVFNYQIKMFLLLVVGIITCKPFSQNKIFGFIIFLFFFSIFYDLDFGRVTQSLIAHEDAVSCLAWGNTKMLLASGSWDCSVQLWSGLTSNTPIRLFNNILAKFDHDSHITCLSFNK